MSEGIIPKGSHLELPASLHTLSVTSYNVQVVIQDHCRETPLISHERKLCHWIPISAVLWTFQSEDMSCSFCFWVFPRSQVLFPEAAGTSFSLCPQVDNFVPLFIIQTPEAWISFGDRKDSCSKLSPCGKSCMSYNYTVTYLMRWDISSRFLLR